MKVSQNLVEVRGQYLVHIDFVTHHSHTVPVRSIAEDLTLNVGIYACAQGWVY